jgi:hypothetical protein
MRYVITILVATCLISTVFAQTSDSTVERTTVTLNSGQLLHLKATPIQLVPAPGSGKLLNLVSIVVQYKSGITPFTVETAGDFSLSLGTVNINVTLPSRGFIDQNTNHVEMNNGSQGGSQSAVENQSLLISNNGSGEWTDGDGSVIVTVYYTVVDLQ